MNLAIPMLALLGSITGDVIGSAYEFDNYKGTDFNLFPENADFTDDTVLTIAIADAILTDENFTQKLYDYGRKYYWGRKYGRHFFNWLLKGDLQPYNSFGNGSAMRVIAVGLAYDTLEKVLEMAEKTAIPTHNHPEQKP
ncbi:ADP-ribosylglycohydrolase [Candidatus Ornithobacterium hominis]|uniref:ADP-ribosylglycohydrolase n=1 Tax=Candidatus Ornithobacterium hominis TaxID=2497989 RepID=A0A383U3R6_9FLAO|nr:ADP-ribosylglycohydrolase family protein [Candidatus Ornithobacterium hominis]MCT7904716.1 ADP-ribosylglycohydrolase family protein [Candidatus Ornithobacterium hominis]SZD73936.1 ADP-ribosylglycohydrolase [Candidatus Ornithobacterium hominis]